MALKSKRPLPAIDGISQLVADLLGRECTAQKGGRFPSLNHTQAALATYVTDDGKIGAFIVCDIRIAASLGAALSLLPASRSQQNIQDNALEEIIDENFREVLNVLGILFNEGNHSTLTLGPIYTTWKDEVTKEHRAMLRGARLRLDMDMNIDRYSNGKIAFFCK